MGYYLGNYWYLLLLVVLPVVGMLLLNFIKWRSRRRERFAEPRFREMLFPDSGWFYKLFAPLYLLAFLFFIFSIIDLLGGKQEMQNRQKMSNVVFLLDVSNSMNAEDIRPNRLAEAKNIMIETLRKLPGSRVGVVVFAGEAASIMPLTTDFSAAENYISGVETSVVKVQGTDFLKAMQVAAQKFKNIPRGSRQVVLLSDGEDNEGNDQDAAKLAEREGISVTAVGIGSDQGAPVPEYEYGQLMGYKADISGETVMTKRQENALRSIAENTGGSYIDGNNLDDASAQVSAALAKRRSATDATVKSENAVHYYQYFLAVSLFLFFLIYLINPKRDFNI